jgi:hypothetical protein
MIGAGMGFTHRLPSPQRGSNMAAEVVPDLSERVSQATQLVSGPNADLEPHLRWVVGELLNRMGPDDLTPQELMGVAVILAGAHARKLSLSGSGEPLAEVIGLINGLSDAPVGGVKRLRLVD